LLIDVNYSFCSAEVIVVDQLLFVALVGEA